MIRNTDSTTLIGLISYFFYSKSFDVKWSVGIILLVLETTELDSVWRCEKSTQVVKIEELEKMFNLQFFLLQIERTSSINSQFMISVYLLINLGFILFIHPSGTKSIKIFGHFWYSSWVLSIVLLFQTMHACRIENTLKVEKKLLREYCVWTIAKKDVKTVPVRCSHCET